VSKSDSNQPLQLAFWRSPSSIRIPLQNAVSSATGAMNIKQTSLPGVVILEPRVCSDGRGFFFESYNAAELAKAGLDYEFVQDNHSRSNLNVLRGLHYQIRQTQGKLVRVVSGAVFDVAVDLRRNSPNFGKWVGVHLNEENKQMLWIPPGFAHGFVVTSKSADFLYKATAYYAPAAERTIRWDDPDIAIEWPLNGSPTVSAKDQDGVRFRDAEVFES